MAELALSIIGLVATAEVVFGRIYKYVKHVKRAERDILELLEQVNVLYGSLQRLSLLRRETSPDVDLSGVRAQDTTLCAKALDRLRNELAEFSSDTPGNPNTTKVHKRWKWPFSKEETIELKRNIESFMGTINIALSIDGISTMLDVLDEVKSMQ